MLRRIAFQSGLPRALVKSQFSKRAGPRRSVAAMVQAGGADEKRADLHATPGVTTERDPATNGYIFQQTMLRIKDPKRSLDFYTRVLGMTLIAKLPFDDMSFTLYFLAYAPLTEVPAGAADRIEQCFSREAVLELTHNHGSEDSDWTAHSGNDDPKGFGHIGIQVPDAYEACERFKKLGVEFQKEPDGGSMKGIAFVKDPDGYWIEVLNAKAARKFFE